MLDVGKYQEVRRRGGAGVAPATEPNPTAREISRRNDGAGTVPASPSCEARVSRPRA